jgi:hypothetical protein
MQTVKVNLKPVPTVTELVKPTEDQIQAALALRCPEHNQCAQLRIENGKLFLDGFCCPAFENHVKQFVERRGN